MTPQTKMNILVLTYQGYMAGSTYSIFYLCRGLAERGHTVCVGCPEDSILFNLLGDTKAIRIPMVFRGKTDRQNMRHIKEIVEQYDIQLVNAQSSKDRYTSIFAKWLHGLKVKIIHTRRQTPASIGGFIQNTFYTKGTQKIVAVSRGVKEALVKLGLAESHIKVIYNGTPLDKYQQDFSLITKQLREKYNLKENDKVVLCVSRRKQQEQLLQAIPLLPRDLTFIFAGIEENPDFKAIRDKYALTHKIIYTGEMPSKMTLAHYGLATLKILPSITEGLSQALLEAMALGVPVVATRAAGNIDLIQDGENGLLFEEKNIEELAQKVTSVIENQNLAKKLRQNGKKTALDTFSIENTITNYENFFQRIIQE